MGKLISSLVSYSCVLNRPSLSISRCTSRYEPDLSLSVVSFISFSMGYMRSTELFSERTSSSQRNVKLQDRASFRFTKQRYINTMLYISAITSIQIIRLTPLEVSASYIYILFHEILQNFPKNVTLPIHKQYLEISRTYQNPRSKLRTCKNLDVFFITYLH